MKLSMKIVCMALAVLMVALVSAQSKKGSYTKVGFSLQSYDYPAFLASPTLTTSTLADGRKEIKFQYSEPIITATNHVTFEVYFDAIAGGSKFDRAVVAALGAYTYKSTPQVAPGSAGIIKIADFTKVGAAEVQIDGSAVYLRYDPAIVNNVPFNAILFRYLPSTVPMANLADDFNSVQPVRLFLSSEFSGAFNENPFKVPSSKVDDIDSPPPPEVSSGFFTRSGSLLATQQVPDDSTQPFFNYDILFDSEWVPQQFPGKDAPRPGGLGPVKMPPTFGIGKGKGDDGRRYQPVPNPLPSDILPVDADGNGTTDYILPGHDNIPYTDLMLGYYVIDNLTIVPVIGKDTNKNGRIDPGEIIAPVGECQFDSAMNGAEIWVQDGHVLIIWKNEKIDPSKNPPDVYDGNRNKTSYVYDVDTGILIVRRYDDQGRLLKWNPGPPPGWIVNPNQDDPNGSWKGPPKDYPGWIKGGQVPKPPPSGGG